MHLTLKLVSGEVLEFDTSEPKIIIGRSHKCDIVVTHEGVSRQHCMIEVDAGQIFITDLGSTNGVLIDGNKIDANTRVNFLPYLSLSFGAVQSAQIDLLENNTNVGMELDSLQRHHPSPDAGHTATTKIDARPQRTPRPMKKLKEEKKEKESEEPLSAKALVAIALLAIAVFWYVYTS